jgi:hypothetical protein
MKALIIALTMFTLSAVAQELPKHMKDGTITVQLKDGKTYAFSTNEYMVVKRGASSAKKLPAVEGASATRIAPKASEPKRHRHIVSGGIVHSNGGLRTATSANEVEIRNRKEFGVDLQYQYNFHKDLYLGGRIDSNGGTGLNLGLGF